MYSYFYLHHQKTHKYGNINLHVIIDIDEENMNSLLYHTRSRHKKYAYFIQTLQICRLRQCNAITEV